jgi:hypothetical protein
VNIFDLMLSCEPSVFAIGFAPKAQRLTQTWRAAPNSNRICACGDHPFDPLRVFIVVHRSYFSVVSNLIGF